MAREVAEVLDEIRPGMSVRLRLRDGSEVTGVLLEKSDAELTLEDTDEGVELSTVEAVMVEASSEGLE